MYDNVLDIINCRTSEVAEKLFDYFASEGYTVSMAGAEINTGTEGSINSKQLTIFKPEEEKKYNSINEMIDDLYKAMGALKGKPCTFATGSDVVTAIGERTLFNVEDWGVYEHRLTGNVTIYNEEAEEIIKLYKGEDSGTVVTTSLRVTALAEMVELAERWDTSLFDMDNSGAVVIKSRAKGLSELTEEEMKDV